MFGSPGPIEIDCDAPPYEVVSASRRADVRSPEDVRWCRLSHHSAERSGWRLILNPRAWRRLLAGRDGMRPACFCGQPLPALKRCTFPAQEDRPVTYLLGQCPRCLTVYWELP
jgi:hypothetical protein